ncbi:gp53-like domain-containing protein [Serratia marcescens]
MHRIDTPTAQIDKFGPGKNGFTNGDPATGRRATDLNSDMWDAVQEEVANAIEGNGIALDKSKHNQLYLAIQKAITDPGFLKKANNLSDVADKAEARGNLGLGTAATKDVGTAIDNVMQVGAFGLGSGPVHRSDAYGNIAEFFRITASSANRPGNNSYGGVRLPIDGGPTTSYVVVGADMTAWIGRSQQQANGVAWARVYTTLYKPTAADVGAYPIAGGFVQGSVTAIGNVSAQNGSILINDKNGVRLFELSAKTDGSVTFSSLLTGKGFSIENNGNITTYIGSQLFESGQRVYSPNNPQPAESTFTDVSGSWVSINRRSGMIMQGGIINRSGDTTNVTFPVAFPGTCSAVIVTQIAQSGASSENIIVSSRSLTGCTLIMRSGEVAANWMAIGA